MKMETKNSGRKPKMSKTIFENTIIIIFIAGLAILLLGIIPVSIEEKNKLMEANNTLATLNTENLDLHNENDRLNALVSDYETKISGYESRITELEQNNRTLSEKIQEYKDLYEVNNTKNIVNTTNKWEIGQEMLLPSIPSNMKMCTDYRFYNIIGTPHNRMQRAAWTDEFGCRRYNDDYIVALGSYYSVDIGDRFEITLDTGRVFTIILGDGKADVDTDINNMYTPCFNYEGEYCANLLEFIIDKDIMSKNAYAYGSLDYHDEFAGDIIKMVYLGRDQGGDWTSYE